MELNLSRVSTFSRLIALCICSLLSFHARAGYVLVQSLDEVAEGGQFLITSEPSLTSGCMLGKTYNESSGYVEGIALNDEMLESEYAEWTITVNDFSANIITCELSFNNKTLALKSKDKTDLEIPSSNKDMAQWELSPHPDINHAFQLKNSAETSRVLCLRDKEGTQWKAYMSSSSQVPYIYLFKRTDVVPPQILADNSRFADPIEVSIEAEEDSEIHYTVDGTAPTTQSPLYTDPFSVSTTTTVKAIAVRDGETSSIATRTFTYCPPVTVNLGGEERLGTLYTSYPVTLPEHTQAYVITDKDDEAGTLTLSAFSPTNGVLPDSVPFILQNENTTSLILHFTTEPADGRPDYAEDLVMGTAERTAKPEDVQILALGWAYDRATLGFYPYTGDTLAANRVYLTLSTTSEYIWVNSVDEYVSGAEYVFASDCKNGKPAGYYAGEYNDGSLTPYQIVEGTDYHLWTLVGTNPRSITIRDTAGDLATATTGTDLLLNRNERNKWEIVTNNNKSLRLRNTDWTGSNYLLYHSYYNVFKNYRENEEHSFYLFRKVTPVATSQGYSFHFDDKAVGIKQATTKPTHGSIYYDLQGRQTTNPSRGMWIINGEKVYINK